MRGADADPDSEIADFQGTDAMHAARIHNGKLLHCFGKDVCTFGLSQRGISLVRESAYGATTIVIAHPALEAHAGTGARVRECATKRRDVDGFVAQ